MVLVCVLNILEHISGDEGFLFRGGEYLDAYMLISGEDQSFSYACGNEPSLFRFGKPEQFVQYPDRGGGLFQQYL